MESPISCFNNITLQISTTLYNILYPELNGNIKNVMLKNQIIFLDNSIIILNTFKLEIKNDNTINIRVLKPLTKDYLKFLINLYENWDDVTSSFCQYIVMYNKIANGFDDVPFILVDYIIKALKTKDQEKLDKYFLIPYKNKIHHLYDNSKDNICKNIFERFEYLIHFYIKNSMFYYTIGRYLSSKLDEQKSLDNLKYEDIEIISKGFLSISKSETFVKQLFYYGEIIK